MAHSWPIGPLREPTAGSWSWSWTGHTRHSKAPFIRQDPRPFLRVITHYSFMKKGINQVVDTSLTVPGWELANKQSGTYLIGWKTYKNPGIGWTKWKIISEFYWRNISLKMTFINLWLLHSYNFVSYWFWCLFFIDSFKDNFCTDVS